jgi:LPS-assembly protein
LDETNLFDTNRFTGFDRYEGGQRLNVGGRATFNWSGGRSATVFAGRSFRAKEDPQFAVNTGLGQRGSDYVLAASAVPIPGIALSGRTRLDGDTGEVRRSEANVFAAFGPVRGNVLYYFDQTDPRREKSHELSFAGELALRRNWGVTAGAVRDLEQDVFRRRALGVFYQDECLRFDIFYEREETIRSASFGPSESIGFRLSLATLGSTGSYDYD